MKNATKKQNYFFDKKIIMLQKNQLSITTSQIDNHTN